MLQRAGYTQNDFERSGNKVPTMEGKRLHVLGEATLISNLLEWTFAKQKWQHGGYAKVDDTHKTAAVLPGWREKVYA